jgi:hypothetical protein
LALTKRWNIYIFSYQFINFGLSFYWPLHSMFVLFTSSGNITFHTHLTSNGTVFGKEKKNFE